MKEWQSHFNGKKVTVMGLGLLGRGVGDIKFLAEEGAKVIVTDLKTPQQLAESLAQLTLEKIGHAAKNITYRLGEHRLEDFCERDFILKAAGAPMDSPFIAEARKNNIPIEMSTALFAALTPATLVGVTGTRGKSTVTHALHTILEHAYQKTNKKVYLGGNVRGVATLPFLRETQPGDVAVLELDSWQLQGFGERTISPHVAVFTTFMSDHMNYYKNDMKAYLADKANIFINQKPEDFLILGEQAEHIILAEYKDEIRSKIVHGNTKSLSENTVIKLPGEHNRYNLGLAYEAAKTLDIHPNTIRKALSEFPGVPGRLEFVRECRGANIYNDTTATTPDATLVGLEALGAEKKLTLIMGGADKMLDFSDFIKALPKFVKTLIVIPGTGSSRLEPELAAISIAHGIQFEKVETLDDAVKKALNAAESGENILFSPAFASFGMFKNEFDRGEQFLEIVRNS